MYNDIEFSSDNNKNTKYHGDARKTIIYLINNLNINKIKNYLIFEYILNEKESNPKKYKNIKNFKELYKLFDIEVISKDILKMLKK